MNYFLTKGYGRFITVPLVLFLILATLTGCQKKTPEATTPSTDDTTPPGLVEVKPTVSAMRSMAQKPTVRRACLRV